MLKVALPLAVLLAAPTAASAADYLSMEPQVVQVPGSASDLAGRAKTCAAKVLSSGAQGGNVIISADATGVVANNSVTYSANLVRWRLRSRVSIEARDGRVRISQDQIERFNEMSGGWGPVGQWAGSNASAAKSAIQGVTDSLAACLKTTDNSVW